MVSTEHSPRQLEPISDSPTSNVSPLYDLVCIGFGPAQLATAIANREAQKPSNMLFLERKAAFSWHPTSQMPRARMETAFVYDLATLRNPKSAFSFPHYLLVQNRLVEFANSDKMNPLRLEFEHYLRWCADQFKDQVRYGSQVVGVAPERGTNAIKSWRVAIQGQDGKSYMVRAKNIVVPSPSSTHGSKPSLLSSVDFLAGQRIISTEDYLSRRNELRQAREPRLNVTIVGSGHQAVEILEDLLSCSGLGNITIVTENESLAPLKILSEEQEPPQPRLCSIWAKPSTEQKSSMTGASELLQDIYLRAYEKQLRSKGEYALRVVMGRDASEACSKADIIVSENGSNPLTSTGLFQGGLDALVLGCRQKGESMEEVQFKRGAVSDGCRMWMMSANSEEGRSLAKDLALRAGEVVSAVGSGQAGEEGRNEVMMINARM